MADSGLTDLSNAPLLGGEEEAKSPPRGPSTRYLAPLPKGAPPADEEDEEDAERKRGGGGGDEETKGSPGAGADGDDGGDGDDDDDDDDSEPETIAFVYQEPKNPLDPSEGMVEVREFWTVDHAKTLYLMSHFAVAAQSAADDESWIRQIPLLVIMYEGVTAGVLDYDYAPASVLISNNGVSRRVWLNVTQEGKAAVDDLREAGLINGLKLSTEDFQPVTAYQVSLKGQQFIKQMEDGLLAEVDAMAHAPEPYKRELLQVTFKTHEEIAEEDLKLLPPLGEDEDEDDGDGDDDEEEEGIGLFILKSKSGDYARMSNVTDTEDVSYVSSPYLPACVRNPREQKAFTSNEHRADESATGTANIRDELSEAIVLSDVMTLVGEWIPFGANQIVALNERLGALDRCQGGLFTAMVDKDPTRTKFSVPPGLTQVSILDFDFVRFINFEAEIHYPEEEGIVQVENFGMHLNVDGTILYGIKIEAIMERKKDSISLDHLSRLLVDVHQDSSQIMNDLLSHYQRDLLDMIFMGDKDQRGKFNMIIAEGIEPFLPAEEYMDRQDNENELKQVIGDLHHVFDVGDDGVLMVGRDGLLVAGANAREYEPLLVAYLSLLVREMFIRNFFVRTFVLDDLLKKTRALIINYRADPNNVGRVRLNLNNASRDIVMLQEMLSYLSESLGNVELPAKPGDASGDQLYEYLDVKTLLHDVGLRTKDLMKLVEGAHHELANLQQMTDVINTKQLEDVFRNVDSNTKYLVDASAASERSSASLEVMQVILAGSFAFDIVDRVSGGSLNITVPDWVNSFLVDPIITVPGLWMLINLAWLGFVSLMLIKLMRYLGDKANGVLTMRIKTNQKISVEAMEAYIATKSIEVSDAVADAVAQSKKTSWLETDAALWKGEPPKIEVLYDETNAFLLLVLFQVNMRNTEVKESEILDIFMQQLRDHKVLVEDGKPKRRRSIAQDTGEPKALPTPHD